MLKEIIIAYLVALSIITHMSLLTCTESTCLFTVNKYLVEYDAVRKIISLVNSQSLISIQHLHLLGHISLLADIVLVIYIVVSIITNIVSRILKLWIYIALLVIVGTLSSRYSYE